MIKIIINKEYYVAVFGLFGIVNFLFPGGFWIGFFMKGESVGEVQIVGAILLVGAVILYYMPTKED